MKDLMISRMAPVRQPKRTNPWLNWLAPQPTVKLRPEDLEPSFEPGTQLLSVAQATLTWWEKHRNDKIVIDGQTQFRYELKPTFVSQAQEVIKRLGRQ